MKRISSIAALCGLLLLFWTCTPQGKLKRAEKRLYKAKQAYEKMFARDTIKLDTTITLPSIKTDTSFSVRFDTIHLEKDKLLIRVIRVRDSIYLSGEVKADTIYIHKEVPIDTITLHKPPFNWNWLYLLLIIPIGYIAYRLKKLGLFGF